MSEAYKCDRCETVEEGTAPGRILILDASELGEGQEMDDLCAGCVGSYIVWMRMNQEE